MSEQNPSSIRRRDILKKGAAVGAVAWSAPLVVSSKAFAQNKTGVAECIHYGVIKIDEDDGPSIGTFHCSFPNASKPNSTSEIVKWGNWVDDTGGSFELADGVTLVGVTGKKDTSTCAPLSYSVSNGVYTVTADYSHIYVVVCRDKPFGGG